VSRELIEHLERSINKLKREVADSRAVIKDAQIVCEQYHSLQGWPIRNLKKSLRKLTN